MRVSHVTRMNLFRYQRLFLHVSSALTPDIRFFFKSLISGSLFRYQRLFSGFFLWVTFQISTSLLRCVYCSSTRYLPVGGSRQNEEKKKCETVEWISATAISCTVPSGVWIFVQHAATRCNTLQHAATHRTTLQHTASHCDCCLVLGAIRCVDICATRCNTLQHAATHYDTLQYAAKHCNTLQRARCCPVCGHMRVWICLSWDNKKKRFVFENLIFVLSHSLSGSVQLLFKTNLIWDGVTCNVASGV